MRYQARHARTILREHGRRSIRQRSARSVGRGETIALRVVQRLREDSFETADGHRGSRRNPVRFQRYGFSISPLRYLRITRLN